MEHQEYRRLTDEELIRRFKERHVHTPVKYIFERYGHIVFGICLKEVKDPLPAKELMEKIFINIAEAMKLQYIPDFKLWLFKYLQAYNKTGSDNIIYTDPIEPEQNNTETGLDTRHAPGEIESALAHLNPDQQLCIKLFYQDNKSCAEIAAVTGYTIEQVKKLLYTGKQNMESDMEAHHAHK